MSYNKSSEISSTLVLKEGQWSIVITNNYVIRYLEIKLI